MLNENRLKTLQKLSIRNRVMVYESYMVNIKSHKKPDIDEETILAYVHSLLNSTVQELIIVTDKGITKVLCNCELYQYLMNIHKDDIAEVIARWFESYQANKIWGFKITK